jgi:hypothetical protein
MTKKKVITRGSSAPVPTTGRLYVIQPETQTQERYEELLSLTNTHFQEAEREHIEYTSRRLVMMWDVGSNWRPFLSAKKNTRGQISDKDLVAVSSDLAPFKTGKRITRDILRTCLRLNETYTKERIEELARLGVNENHVSVFLQLEDKTERTKLENRAVKENLNGHQIRDIVRDMASDPSKAGAVKGTTKARIKQEATKKKVRRQGRIDNPSKMVDYITGQFESLSDDIADLSISLKNVEKLEQGDRSALTEPLDDLVTRLGEMILAFTATKDSAKTALVAAKGALSDEGKTQGVKGGDKKKGKK